MTDHSNGLRFDIYERVYLPDNVAAIDELEEIELVPHMQVLPQENQILLRGHLLLSGVYRAHISEGEPNLAQLEHWIPVEIALPLDRVQNLEELAVEIDNFDIDLLHSRSLNVTGVLALRGLQDQDPQSPIWHDESFTVVNQTQQEESFAQHVGAVDPLAQEKLQQQWQGTEPTLPPVQPDIASSYTEQNLQVEPSMRSMSKGQDRGEVNLNQEKKGAMNKQTSGSSGSQTKQNSWAILEQTAKQKNIQDAKEEKQDENTNKTTQEPPSSAHVPATDDLQPDGKLGLTEKNELTTEKLAFKVMLDKDTMDANIIPQKGMGLLSQFGHKGDRNQDMRSQEKEIAEPVAEQEVAQVPSKEEIEWAHLFLSDVDKNDFRKVRMCIVQKEETLATIAERYELQPRELQLYNRLEEPYISEGQVIYIP